MGERMSAEEGAGDDDYEAMVQQLAAREAGMPVYAGLGETDDNYERPYANVDELPEREVTQTDHMNARLLSSFDKLLSSGAFKVPQVVEEEQEAWQDDDDT